MEAGQKTYQVQAQREGVRGEWVGVIDIYEDDTFICRKWTRRFSGIGAKKAALETAQEWIKTLQAEVQEEEV